MDNKEAEDLINKFQQNNLTDQEKAAMQYWLHHLHENGESGLSQKDLADAQEDMWKSIKPTSKSIYKHRFLNPIATAAVLFITLSAGVYIWVNKYKPTQLAGVSQQANLILPGSNKAILTLANGNRIVLNDAANGHLTEESGISISKSSNGQLIYTVGNEATANRRLKVDYNTIETPRGGQYQINLSDGSKVWLNALSKLRFPARFSGNERAVELSGEGYFEITHNKQMPFKVSTNQQQVEVLGTHFNISSYSDENITSTTLLEGSVKVSPLPGRGNMQIDNMAVLKPGEQSVLKKGSLNIAKVDAEASIAWKNGFFKFDDENLESIMRKISRWYDVTVIFQTERIKSEPFAGVITRFSKVEDLLRTLELTGEVKFRIEGKSIIVMDKNQKN